MDLPKRFLMSSIPAFLRKTSTMCDFPVGGGGVQTPCYPSGSAKE